MKHATVFRMVLITLVQITTTIGMCAEQKRDTDMRPIVLVTEENVFDKTQRKMSVDITGMSGLLEVAFEKTGLFRVLSKNSVRSGMQDFELFKRLTQRAGDELKIDMPTYRVEVIVNQFSADAVQSTRRDYHKHKKDSQTRLYEQMKYRVALVFNVTDMRNMTIVFSRAYDESCESDVRKIGTLGTIEKLRVARGGKSLFESEEKELWKLTSKIFEDVAHDLVRRQSFRVLDCSEDGVLTVDVPSSLVKTGDVLDMYSQRKTLDSARTGRPQVQEVKVATISVVEVMQNGCTAIFKTIDDVSQDWNVVVKLHE